MFNIICAFAAFINLWQHGSDCPTHPTVCRHVPEWHMVYRHRES